MKVRLKEVGFYEGAIEEVGFYEGAYNFGFFQKQNIVTTATSSDKFLLQKTKKLKQKTE